MAGAKRNLFMKQTISAIVLTYDNSTIIERFLKSVAWVDEVILVDSFSADATCEIAIRTRPDCVILQQKFKDFSSQRNYGLQTASSDWVMHFDSDHVVPKSLAEEILALTSKNTSRYDAYNVYQNLYWFGQILRHASGPVGFGVFLHRKGVAKFNNIIHEKCIATCKVGMLKERLEHVTEQTISDRIRQLSNYVEQEVQSIEQNERTCPKNEFAIFWRPLRRLVYDLIYRRAFLDGIPGIAWAVTIAYRKHAILFCYWAKSGKWKPYSPPDFAETKEVKSCFDGHTAAQEANNF
jgi:glycosyltransferase involved in cell wall biosynthesis